MEWILHTHTHTHLTTHEGAPQVDVEGLVPLLQRGLLAGRVHVDAGVVAGDVDRPPSRDDGVDHPLHIIRLADVSRDGKGADTCIKRQLSGCSYPKRFRFSHTILIWEHKNYPPSRFLKIIIIQRKRRTWRPNNSHSSSEKRS